MGDATFGLTWVHQGCRKDVNRGKPIEGSKRSLVGRAKVEGWTMTEETCPLCNRELLRPSDHHLVPKCRGGKKTTTICQCCHVAIHAIFNNKELESTYNTVEALMGHEKLAKTVKFISKQDPSRPTKTDNSDSRKGRRRNG